MERQVETTIKRVLKCNTEDRTALAHSLLQPNTDGSIDVRHGKATEVKWSRDAFAAKIEQLDKLADELRALNGELRTFKYTIPDLGWMPTSNFEPTMGMMRHRGIPDALRATLPSG